MRAIQKSGQAAKQETRIINDFCALIWRQDGRRTGASGCERRKEGAGVEQLLPLSGIIFLLCVCLSHQLCHSPAHTLLHRRKQPSGSIFGWYVNSFKSKVKGF